MLDVFAEFERSMIRKRVMAGLGVAAIMAARAKGTGIRRIARDLGVGVGTVLRVTGEVA